MAWLSRNNFTPSDKLHADDLNNLANDIRTWGGDVNGGGYTLSNVHLVGVVPVATGGVSTVFGRSGDVVAQAGDYTAAQVGAVPIARQVIAGAGLTGGGALSSDVTLMAAVTSVFGRTGAVTLTPADLSSATAVINTRMINTGTGLTGGGNLAADRTLSVVPDSVVQRVQVSLAGSTIGTRPTINFIHGPNVTLGLADNAAANRVDVTVDAINTTGLIDPTTTVGDLIVRGLSAPGRLGVGTNGQTLIADNLAPLGMRWATPTGGGGGAITSVFSRTGAIAATSGDYTAAQVTNAVDVTQSYANPNWLTSLAWSKIISAPNFVVDSTIARGDLLVRGAATIIRLPIGGDGQVLIADSTQPLGMHWGSVAAGGGGGQSPWTMNVDAAGFNLSSAGSIGVNMPNNSLARISVTAAGGEDGLRIIGASPTGWADISLFNDQTALMELVAWGSGNTAPFASVASIHCWAPLLFAQNNVEVMRLSPSGQLGVGVANPAYSVDVSGDVNVTGGFLVNGHPVSGPAAQTPWLTDVDAAGFALHNVKGIAIGATAAANSLRIAASNPEIVLIGATDNDVPNLQMWCGSAHRWEVGVGRVTPGQFYIRDVNHGIFVQIDANGFVGMGHAAVYALDVLGDINCTGTYRINGIPTGGVLSVFSRTGAVIAELGDYTAAQIINAVDTSQTYGDPNWITSLSWNKITGSPPVGVSSVFGRSGAVVAATGDYTVSQVLGAVPNTRMIDTGTGLTGGGNLSADRTLSVIPDSVNQRVLILSGAAPVATRRAINFVAGSNVTISVTDNAANNWIDVAVASTGGGTGGGMTDPTTNLGDLIVRGAVAPSRFPIGLNGQVLTVDNTQLLGVRWAPAAEAGQTPWVANIDGAFFQLNNTGSIGVNQASNSSVARVFVLTNGMEDGVQTICHLANQFAAMSVVNDIADYLRVISYGSGNAIDPGISAIESSVALKFVVGQLNEAMRLVPSGRVLIGTTTDDGTNLLQVQGTIRSAAGGFVFPDGTVQTTAFTAANSPVLSVFGRVGAVVAQSGDYTAAQVVNAVSIIGMYSDPPWITGLAWSKILGAPTFLIDPMIARGDLIAHGATSTTRLPVGLDGQILTADSTEPLGLKWAPPGAAAPVTSVFGRTGAVTAVTGDYTAAQVTNAVDKTVQYSDPPWILSLSWSKITGVPPGGQNQTPWLSDINAANYALSSLRFLAIGIASPQPAPTVGFSVTGTQGLTTCIITEGLTTGSAALTFNNDAAQAYIRYYGSGSSYPNALGLTNVSSDGPMFFNLAGAERMRITPAGNVGIGTTAPNSKLTVQGTQVGISVINAAYNQNYYFGINDLDASKLYIGAGKDPSQGIPPTITMTPGMPGLVGIGTTTPANALSVQGHMNVDHAGANDGTWLAPGIAFGTAGSGEAISSSRTTGSANQFGLDFWVNAVPRMSIQSGTGNVTIGMRQPTGDYALSVRSRSDDDWNGCLALYASNLTQGAAYSFAGINTSYYFKIQSAQYVSIQANGGWVGIRTNTTPNPLTVNADVIRQLNGGYGIQWLNDGSNNFYLLLTNNGDPYGGWNSLRPFYVQMASGDVTMSHTVHMGGAKVGAGAYNNTVGDLGVSRDNSPGTGCIYFGNSAGVYLYWDGANFTLTNYLSVGGGIYTNGNINIGGDYLINGGTITGAWWKTIDGRGQALFNAGAITIGTGSTYTPDGLTIGTLGSVGYGQMRLMYSNYGVIFRNDGATFHIMVTNAGDPWGVWKGPFPFLVDLASCCVGIRVSPNPSFGLNVDSINCGGLWINGSPVSAGGGMQTINFHLNAGALAAQGDTIDFRSGTNTTCRLGFFGSGVYVAWDAFAPSDLRIKQNVRELTGGLPIVNQLRPIEAEFNGLGGRAAGERTVSVIAQELQKILPGAVHPYREKLRPEDKDDTELLSVDPHEMLMHAILAIQQLEKRLQALEGKVN